MPPDIDLDTITAIRCRAAWLCGVIDGCRKTGIWPEWMTEPWGALFHQEARTIWFYGPDLSNKSWKRLDVFVVNRIEACKREETKAKVPHVG